MLDGLTGIAIIFFLLAKYRNDKIAEEKGVFLLEWVSENGANANDLNFGTGLTGIGWAIEWLVQNGLMTDTNTDEILDPIDSLLYNIVSYSKDENFSLLTGTLGKIEYFRRRAMSNNPGTHRYKTIGHLECIVLLLDDLANQIPEIINLYEDKDKYCNNIIMKNSLFDLGSILTSISSININTNTPTLGHILFNGIKYCEAILSNAKFNNSQKDEQYSLDITYLATTYLISAKNKKNKYWEERAIGYTNDFIQFMPDNTKLTMKQLFQKMNIYCMLYIYLRETSYSSIIEELKDLLYTFKLPFTLFEGKGTLVLAELCLEAPDLIQQWYELFFFA
ncbi:glycoside hydrolase family protein [Rhizosphaericola mali]|uniref:Lanthionine synthetase C family protein n=1 Tax=Rhizosphaericola mali TaxID=2545455 RepID=A0A5P2G5D6_9BACT|nr:hypothetical protein [Rhizosphaericola mali]QES91044.1 hypothetical protein E0W69_020230 [Rhizosphaericola mali]